MPLEISAIIIYIKNMIARQISQKVIDLANTYFSVCLFGPRQCGKTTLAKTLFPTYSYANLEDMDTRSLAKNDPKEFFVRFPEPVIIDEIQRVPELLSTVQVRIDEKPVHHHWKSADSLKKFCCTVFGRKNRNCSNAASFHF